MPIRLIAITALFCTLLLFAAVACGGDDNGGASPSQSAATTAPTATEPGQTPGDEKTPSSETPGDGETPAPTTTGPSITPGTGGTPAIAPADQTAYLQQFSGASVDRVDCGYDPATLLADCGADGKFAVDPPLGGQDVSCQLGLVDGKPVFVNCMSQVPLQSIYYEIK